MEMAHEGMIWSLAWHPLGHILCSGSNDHTRYTHTQARMLTQCETCLSEVNMCDSLNVFSKFWTRNRPGDKMRDRYNLNLLPGMSEDGVEYGRPLWDKVNTVSPVPTLCVNSFVCDAFR